MLTEGRVRAIAAQVALAIAKKIKPSVSEEQIRSDVEAVIRQMQESGELTGSNLTAEQVTAQVKAALTDYLTKEDADKTYQPLEPPQTEPAATDLPRIFFVGNFPKSKLDGNESLEMTYISKTARFSAYVIAKVQGSSSTTFAKKNYTFELYDDEAHKTEKNVVFRNWPAKYKFVAKANTIDRTHARNVVSCRIWGDMVKSRAGYADLPAELRNSPNQGAIDGFPVQIYLNGVYQGLYTWNIPKDGWMAGVNEDLEDKHAIICGEGAGSGAAYVSFNAAYSGDVSPINGSDWDDECGTVGENIRANFKAFSDLVVSGTDEEFKSGLSTYMNIESLIDSFIFKWLACDVDGLGKNQFMYTYNAGMPWYSGVYDLDSTWGLKPEGYALASYDTIMPDDYYYPYTNNYTNMLYARLWQLFETEVRARWNEVKEGALSLANIINHFEAFHDAIPHELFAEDSAETTADGLFVNGSGNDNKGFAGMLGVDKSNIQQIRNFAAARWVYVDGQINRIACKGISLSVTSLALTNVNATGAITAILTPENCNDPVAWTSSSDAVAIVSGGTVTAIGNGSCTITATCGGFSATCTVTVSGFAAGEVGSDNLADPDGGDWYNGYEISGDGNLINMNVNTIAATNKIEFRAGDVFTIEGAQAKYKASGNASHGFYNLDGTPAGWAVINATDMVSAGNLTVSNKVTTIKLTEQMINDKNIKISHGYVRFQLKVFDGQSVIDTENIVIRRNPNGENADAWA